MSKLIATLATWSSTLVLVLPGYASANPPNGPGEMPAATSSRATASATSTIDTATASDPNAKDLSPIVVTVPKPYIWTFQKGNSKVLVLGMVYPEPERLTFVPGSIHHAIAQSGAVIGPPAFHFEANVNLFNVWSVWHEASGAKYLPDGKQLSDVLSASDLQQWNVLKARYLSAGDKVDHLRPMYAGWKLYDAVLKHSGVAVDASVYDLIKSDADKRGIPMIDGQFHWTVKDPKTAAKAFEPSPQADLACFERILGGIEGVPDSARTLATSWAVGDIATMKTYLGSHKLTNPCWAGVTQDAVAQQQGLDRDEEERKAWLAAFNTAAAKYPVVFTTAYVQNIFKPAHQIEWLLQEGYVTVDPDAQQPAAASTTPAIPVADHADHGMAQAGIRP